MAAGGRPTPVDEIEIVTFRQSYSPNTSDDSGEYSSREFPRPIRPFAAVNPDISHPSLASRGWDSNSSQTLTNNSTYTSDTQPPSPVCPWGIDNAQTGPLGNRNSYVVLSTSLPLIPRSCY